MHSSHPSDVVLLLMGLLSCECALLKTFDTGLALFTIGLGPGVPLRVTLIQFALLVDVDTKESVVELQVLASSVVKLAIHRRITGRTPLQAHLVRLIRSQNTNTTTSTSGQADKKPGASGRVFAITEGQAANTSEHHATIDCHSYRVIFGDIHAPEYIYHGSLARKSMQIISALQARTLLYHGCEGFLATIHDTTPEVPSIHEQPIVSEFTNVFPDELPGIPLVREVEFNIEL
nr:putative reverse transcriptase domain, aspartic peptidase domain protein [Tanacetum cinerariifolium]